MIVGIDFGTCYSSVSIMIGEYPDPTFVKGSVKMGIDLGTPSLFLHHGGNNYFGTECEVKGLLNFRADIIKKMKKEVLSKHNNINNFVESGGKKYTFRDIIEMYLRYLIQKTVDAVSNDNSFVGSKDIEEITIAVPAGIGTGQELSTTYREILHDILCDITGLESEHVHTIEEPSAAAISFLYDHIRTHYEDTQAALVFDLGGGTLDISIVEHDPDSLRYTVKVLDGDVNLGGEDWDRELANIIRKKLTIQLPETAESKYDFDKAITDLKLSLSQDVDGLVKLNDKDNRSEFIQVTRDEFENATKDLLDRAVDKLKSVIDSYKPGIEKINKVVLVGGGSNMPQIRNRIVSELQEYVDASDIVFHNPSKAIAMGASIHAAMEATTGDPEAEEIVQIVPHTYGVKLRRIGVGEYKIVNMIFKNTSFDSDGKVTKVLDRKIHGVKGNTRIRITVFETDDSRLDGINGHIRDIGKRKAINDIEIKVPIPEKYIGKEDKFKIMLEMSLNTNGILEIIAIDENGTRYRASKSL